MRMNIGENMLVCTQGVLGLQAGVANCACISRDWRFKCGVLCQGKGMKGHRESLRLGKTMVGQFWGEYGLFFKTLKFCCWWLKMRFLQVATNWTLPIVSMPSVRPPQSLTIESCPFSEHSDLWCNSKYSKKSHLGLTTCQIPCHPPQNHFFPPCVSGLYLLTSCCAVGGIN